MQFGMPVLLEAKSLETCAVLCRDLGLKFVELNMNLPEYQTDRMDEVELREIADKYNIYYTIHLDDYNTPCDFNNKISAAYVETMLSLIEIAKRIDMPILNMHLHPGTYFTMPDKKIFLFEEYEREHLQKLTVFRDACTESIAAADIKICVENCGDYAGKSYIQKGLALLLQSPVFALTFDVGHNATANYSDEPTIIKYADRLAHFHIHDAAFGRGNHLTLGDGDVDLTRYLDMARTHNCRAVLEVKTADGLRCSAEWIKQRGY